MNRTVSRHVRLMSGNVKVSVTDEKSNRYGQTGMVVGRNLKRDMGGYYDVVSFGDGMSHMKMDQYRVLEEK